MTLTPKSKRLVALMLAIAYIALASVSLYREQLWGLLIPLAGVVVALCLVTRAYDRDLLHHPVSVAVMLSLGWMLITAFFSHDIGVSLKYWAARLWFVIPCYFAAAQIFQNPKRIRQLYTAYALLLAVIVVITTLKTVGNTQDLQLLHRVMRPFYNDHTAYGCVTALFLPAAVHFLISRDAKLWQRLFYLALAVILTVGLAFSYARAAWISLVGAIGVGLLIRWGQSKMDDCNDGGWCRSLLRTPERHPLPDGEKPAGQQPDVVGTDPVYFQHLHRCQ